MQRSRSYPVSTIMADLDGLKRMTDEGGHAAGDDFLRRAARVLQESMRAEDVLARIGGDEFAALLPFSDHEVASSIIDRIRKNLEDHNQAYPGPPLSISIGMDTGQKGSDLTLIMQAADRFMFIEKARKKAANPLLGRGGEHGPG